ncbi:ABC transporter substrate-binding protein [Roseibium salinum]|uniref:NrtA/SsuA/CpmA family ABC transporter substrate-binding protein n=1 Tax=Roseibium salinum TaxID=1604349 RepID=A0ABT3QVE1_9HYPH|nr:NrtA/SsuA/CpmA family ABC transporter substrate-binding protein [Roseibium sp. DSM 29163]MCX2720891.1 NrtA/SsuA/CpmA family ABC transporter substrate-binding protein [Roseibium sp. DSM 29163]
MYNPLKSTFLAAGLATMATAAMAQDTEITFGGGAYLDIPQLSVAMDHDLFAKHGLDVNVIPFQSGRAAFEALLGGQLDVAVMAEFPAVVGAMRDQEFKVIAGLSRYQATRIIHTGDARIDSVADLAGKPIGVTAGTNVHFWLENELRDAGVEAEIVSVGPPDIVPALARGDIFAGAMFPSFYGGAKEILGDKYQEIPISSYETHFILVATQELIDDNPDAVTAVLSALVEAEEVVKADPTESHEAVSRVLSGTLKPEEVAEASANYSFNVSLDEALIDLMVDEGVWINQRGSIKGDVPTRDSIGAYFDSSFLAEIDASRVSIN